MFFGGRPLAARTDDRTIRELRRVGLRERQALYALRGNTGNFHIHIAGDIDIAAFRPTPEKNPEFPAGSVKAGSGAMCNSR
ncbi:MAG: hypothetical protein LBQ63_01475 [Deltaproteobacteria bacterium]|nr:hypothetical protein [Deltaproteobacteria bacterium]